MRCECGLDVANPRAALATAFERLLAASPPDQIASDRAALRIPEDYALSAPSGHAEPLAALLDRLDEFADVQPGSSKP